MFTFKDNEFHYTSCIFKYTADLVQYVINKIMEAIKKNYSVLVVISIVCLLYSSTENSYMFILFYQFIHHSLIYHLTG